MAKENVRNSGGGGGNRMDEVLTEMAARLDEFEQRLNGSVGRVHEIGAPLPLGSLEVQRVQAQEWRSAPKVFVLPDGKRIVLDNLSLYEAVGVKSIRFWWNGGNQMEFTAYGEQPQDMVVKVMASLDAVFGTRRTEE